MLKNNNRGFTLLEVLLVVALLGIILAITVPNIGKGSEKANNELCASTKLIVQGAVEQYEAVENRNFIIASNIDLVDFLHREGYLRHKLQCPNQGNYKYIGKEVICSCSDKTDTQNQNK